MDLTLCPVVSRDEANKKTGDGSRDVSAEAVRRSLQKLGQIRAGHIRSYLIEQHMIDGNRLLICPTRIEDTSSSAVELKF